MNFDKVFGVAQLVLAQVPGLVSGFTQYRLSIYQPAIYKGHEAYLILPLFVGLVATWSVMQYKRRAMWALVPIFVVLMITVISIYSTVDVFSGVHALNWALSYCLVAVFFAFLYGVVTGP
jgi:FtsH-binding integral membrane protein